VAAVRFAILMIPILLDSGGVASGQLRAFPEAEGFGAYATGGRGGTVYHVTTLNDSGAGSFRDAVSSGNRIVVFDVGGWIELASPVSVQSNITIAGQTAPGQGIGLKNYGISFSNRDNVIARHLRVRQGPYVDSVGRDAVGATNASNVIFDHMSVSWGRDENFSITNSSDVTIQNSIIAEGLLNHSMGGLIEWNEGISIHHSLYISNNDRNPKTKGILDFVNNVVFDWGAFAYVAGDSAGLSYGNVVNNYFIAGPSSSELHDPISRGNRNYSIYLDGNHYDGNLNDQHDGLLFTPADVDDVLTYVPERFDYPLISTDSAERAYEKVLNNVGASLSRDSVDARLVNGVVTRTGMLISDPAVVGGWGTLAGGAAPTDTDQDGMPDDWETDHGLNPANASDRNNLNLFGYTRIEEYLNELGGAHTKKNWDAADGAWSMSALWSPTGLPTDDDNAFVQGSGGVAGAVNVDQPGAAAWDVRVGGNGAATLTVSAGGDLRVVNTLTVGASGAGSLDVDGGTVTAQNVVIGSHGFGGSVNVTGGGVLSSRFIAPDGVGGAVTLQSGTIAAAAGDLEVTAPVNLVGVGTFDTAEHDATVSSTISGGELVKTGEGVLTLTSTNNYSGGTSLTGGTLAIATSANIGGVGSQIDFTGGTLRVTGTGLSNLDSHSVNWSSFDGGIDVNAAVHTFTISQTLDGSGTFTKRGAGTLVLSSANNHGGTVAAGGVLSVLDDTRLGAPAAPLGLEGGTLRFTTTGASTVDRATTLSGASTIDVAQASGVITLAQPVGGTGAVSKAGPGTLILAAANTYTGATTIASGTLRITNPLALKYTTVVFAGGTLDLNGLTASVGGLAGSGTLDLAGTVLTLGGSNEDSSFAGSISSSSGVASVEKVGTGTINLAGNNTYSGGTVLRDGGLGITTDANIGGSTSTITFDGGLLRINGTTLTSIGSHVVNWSSFEGGFDVASSNNTFTVSQTISGSGSLTKRGAGRLVLSSASNTFAGGTRLEGGSLEIASLANIGGSTAAITFAGGILRTSGTGITSLASNNVNWSGFDGGFDVSSSGSTLTLSQAIGGTGSMTNLGSGTLRMTVANTYTGDTNLNAGTLLVEHADALASTNLVPGGGTLGIAVTNFMNIGGLKGSGNLALGGFTVNVGANDQDTTYSGALSSTQGQGQFNKVGDGRLTLTGNSSYARPIVIQEGSIAVSNVANAGSNSSLGTGASASMLVLDGGKLVFDGGTADSTNRLFTVTENGGAIECAGAGRLQLTSGGSILQSGTGDRTFTLLGVNSDCEFNFALGDPSSGKTSFRKDEGGRWIMNGAAGTLTYSGDTIIDAGILILNGNARLPFGPGKGNLVINEGQFEMNGRDMSINGLFGAGNIQNRTSTRTLTLGNADADGDFSGVVSNTGGGGSAQLLNVTKVGTGTQIFSGFNTYGGLTDVEEGTLVMASRAAAGFSSILASSGVLRVDPGADEALELFKTVDVGGSTSNPTGTIDVASGGFLASKAAGNSLATLLDWQEAGIVQNNGRGLVSSWVESNSDYGLAVIDNADLGLSSFHGRDVTTDSLIVAPALLGDTNLDNAVNFADLVTLAENYGASNGTWDVGDFNADRMMTDADLALIEQQYGASAEDFAAAWALAQNFVPLPGDYNGNGVVDAADYTVWRDRLGQTFQLTNENPDDTNPGFVDQDDYAFWKSQFGSSVGSGAGATGLASAIPEPSAARLFILGVLLCWGNTFLGSRRGHFRQALSMSSLETAS
jgi:autotransporter-associated beta strand protein